MRLDVARLLVEEVFWGEIYSASKQKETLRINVGQEQVVSTTTDISARTNEQQFEQSMLAECVRARHQAARHRK